MGEDEGEEIVLRLKESCPALQGGELLLAGNKNREGFRIELFNR
jgi:urease accessory protein UreE